MATIRTFTIPRSVSPARIAFRSETGKVNVTAGNGSDTAGMKFLRQIPNGPVMRVEAARKPNFRRNTFPIMGLMSGVSLVNLANAVPARKRSRRALVNA